METSNRWTIANPGRAAVFKDNTGWRAVLAGGSVSTPFRSHADAYDYAHQHTILYRDYWHPGWRRERSRIQLTALPSVDPAVGPTP